MQKLGGKNFNELLEVLLNPFHCSQGGQYLWSS